MPAGSAGLGGAGWPYIPIPPSGGGSGGAGGGYGVPPPSFPGLDDTMPGGGGGASNPQYEAHKDDPLWHEGYGPYGWGTTPGSGGGGGYGPGGGPEPPKPQELNLDTKMDPYLEELVGRERGYLDNLEGGTGRIMDITAGRLRDAREGGRKAVSHSAAFRGVDDTKSLGDYDAETTRGEQAALADVSVGREALMGSALQGALGIFGAPASNALQQQSNQIGAFQANTAANMSWWNATNLVGQQNFGNWMSILGLQNDMMRTAMQPGGY